MGALHDGHAALVRRCREECATTVASIFVNPMQFGPGEDLDRYPRPFEADRARLAELGCDVLFAPAPEEMVRAGEATSIEPGPLAARFEGAERPGHFSGVCTIVMKLFHVVRPDRAYFGRKDAQQLAIVTAMARDLDLDLEIVPVDTVRDPDGLALSSRNAYLSPEERVLALGLSRGLFRARDRWGAGERDPARLVAAAREPGLAYDYLECVDPLTFAPPPPGGPALLVAAVRVGRTRLLDNCLLGSPAGTRKGGPE